MEIHRQNHEKLISDIVFLTQKASTRTCEVVARTISSNAKKYLSEYPGMVRDVNAFTRAFGELQDCILSLRNVRDDIGKEIMIKMQALDLLLALNEELKFSFAGFGRKGIDAVEQEIEPEKKSA